MRARIVWHDCSVRACGCRTTMLHTRKHNHSLPSTSLLQQACTPQTTIMGRSQVNFNKIHGRPGSKGRGIGGRGRGSSTASSRRQHQQPLGDNAWRYDTKSHTASTTADEMDLEMLNLETQKLPQYMYSETVETEAVGQERAKGISVKQMGKALDQLSVSQRLGIPSYLTLDLEVRDVSNRSMPSQGGNVNKPPVSTQEPCIHRDETDEGAVENNREVPAKDEKDATDREDDLDAWLDSVIT